MLFIGDNFGHSLGNDAQRCAQYIAHHLLASVQSYPILPYILPIFFLSCRIFGSSSSIFDFTPQHVGVKQSRGKKRFEPYRRTAGNLTWTHKFVCLAESDQEDLPSAAEKYKLKCNDLGEKKVVFEQIGGKSKSVDRKFYH